MKMRRNRRVYDYYQMAAAQRHRPPPLRIRDAWPTLVLGMLALFSGVLLIIWNEAKAVAATRALEESAAAIIDIQPDQEIDSSLVGKLIYVTGAITVQEPVTDPDYGISVPAVKLKRRVQMFQWIEEEYKQSVNGEPPSSQHFYYTDWRDKAINSAQFSNARNHENPKEFPIKAQILVNDKVKLGKFELGEAVKEKFIAFEEITSDERPESKDVKIHAGLYYHSQDVWNPDVGDLRIQFSYAGMHGQDISIIGKIDKNKRIVPYKTHTGVNVLLMRFGNIPKEDIFFEEHAINTLLTWIYRGLSWFLIYIGSYCMSRIFMILCQQSGAWPEDLPQVNMAMSISIFLLVTAFAWIWYRPSLGIFLFGGMVAIIYLTGYYSERHTRALQAAYAAQAAEAAEAAHAVYAAHAAHAAYAARTFHTRRHNRL